MKKTASGDGRLMKEWVVVGVGGAPWVDLAKRPIVS